MYKYKTIKNVYMSNSDEVPRWEWGVSKELNESI